jgi:type VI secretion system FHA domain protein
MSVTTIQPVENNPLKFSATVDDAIELMFVKRAKAYKPPLEAVREGFDGIADHQIAVIAGMRAAFEAIIRRFDPEQLQQRFERQQKAGLLLASKKARYWEAYQALYEDLTRDADEAFQLLFGDDFVQSYESQLTRLAVARKRGQAERNV